MKTKLNGSRTDTMKRFWPLLLILGGVLIVVGGFFYQLFFGGAWGYQDPTPKLSASCALHSRIASVTCWCGVAVFLIGWVAGIRRFWPLLPIIGGGLLAVGGFGSAAAFAGRPELADFVRIARIASMLGWCGVGVFLFGAVAGVIRRVTRKPSVASLLAVTLLAWVVLSGARHGEHNAGLQAERLAGQPGETPGRHYEPPFPRPPVRSPALSTAFTGKAIS